MREGSEKTTAEALDYVEAAAGRFVVHFEMDVIDFVDLPVADVPRTNAGLTFGEALECLGTLASSPKLAGLVVTEFNPDRADEADETAAVII